MSNVVEFEYWPTRIGLFEVIVEFPSMICWCTWPRFRVATDAPLTWTSVPSCEARNRNVSPPLLVFSGTVPNVRPQVCVGGICSTMWSQAKKIWSGMFAHWWPP